MTGNFQLMQHLNHQFARTYPTKIAKILAILIICLSTLITNNAIDDRFLRDACALGGILVAFNGFVYVSGKRDLLVFLYPSAIAINYLYLSMLVGAIGFYNGSIAIAYMQSDPFMWSPSSIPNVFLALVVVFAILFANYDNEKSILATQNSSLSRTSVVLVILFSILLVFQYNKILFGEQIIGSIFCIYVLSVVAFRKFKTRLFLYSVALIPFMMAMIHSKLEVIFLL